MPEKYLGQSPPQELEVGPPSGHYLLVSIIAGSVTTLNYRMAKKYLEKKKLHCTLLSKDIVRKADCIFDFDKVRPLRATYMSALLYLYKFVSVAHRKYIKYEKYSSKMCKN